MSSATRRAIRTRSPPDRADTGIRRAYGSGISSTGMYMRDFLYLGFNEDEAHRKVFDAVQITIPGTHRLFANVEFADPNTYSRQDMWHDSLSYSYPPLTFAVTTDPISGIRDGILKRPATDPLVFQVDSANEFWQMNASLNVHDGQGRPVPTPDNVRLYFASSFHHVGVAGLLNPPGPPGMCEIATQGNGWAPTLRALLVALDEWADRGIAPPPSNYPRVEDGTLVGLADLRGAFPAMPGVRFPTALNELALPDFGSGFTPTGGRVSKLPPSLGARYQVLVPKPDRDGLDLGGIRSIEVVGADGDDHRLERPRDRAPARRSVRAERRDDPVCEDEGGARGQQGSAAVARRAVRQQGRLRPRRRGRGAPARQGALPAAGGRGSLHAGRPRRRRAVPAGDERPGSDKADRLAERTERRRFNTGLTR